MGGLLRELRTADWKIWNMTLRRRQRPLVNATELGKTHVRDYIDQSGKATRTDGVYGSRIKCYGNENQSHLAMASAVGRGEADVAVGSEKIARQVENIEFVPLQQERYDLVIKKEHFDRPEAATMLKILRSERFRKRIQEYRRIRYS
jgi:molybdate-binding protein